jgi:hypothetical protein
MDGHALHHGPLRVHAHGPLDLQFDWTAVRAPRSSSLPVDKFRIPGMSYEAIAAVDCAIFHLALKVHLGR